MRLPKQTNMRSKCSPLYRVGRYCSCVCVSVPYRMIPIIEVFLGLSIGIAILWLTVLALVKFTRRVISGEEWQDVLKDLWKKPLNGVLPAKGSEDSRGNGQPRRKNL